MQQDVLADVFRILKVSDARYDIATPWAPWALEVDTEDSLGLYAMIDGQCTLRVPGAEPHRLRKGDVAVLLGSRTHAPRRFLGVPGSDAPTSQAAEQTLPPRATLLSADGREGARVLTASIRCQQATHGSLGRLLPPAFVIRDKSHVLPWLEATLDFIVEELSTSRPGGQSIARRLTEMLFVQLVNSQLGDLDETGTAGLTALGDPQVGHALDLIHSSPQAPWTVASLARELGMSRSAFANHFVHLVGEPPVHYLTRVRMEKAAELLRDGRTATGEIAARVGYVSDASFCKAFKRAYGQSPGAYRRSTRQLAGPEAAPPAASPHPRSLVSGEAA